PKLGPPRLSRFERLAREEDDPGHNLGRPEVEPHALARTDRPRRGAVHGEPDREHARDFPPRARHEHVSPRGLDPAEPGQRDGAPLAGGRPGHVTAVDLDGPHPNGGIRREDPYGLVPLNRSAPDRPRHDRPGPPDREDA